MAARATRSASASFFVPHGQTFAHTSRAVVKVLPSQSHHTSDSFPSHVPWVMTFSVAVGQVPSFASSCHPAASFLQVLSTV